MSVSTPPKVSVCMPVYNGGDYIADSIQSVLTQTYKNFNLIVCDNCSTDNTEEIIRNFNDPRLIYVRNKKNLGLVGNHNRCLELANGEYVYFLHHDDIMLPDNLALKVRLLDKHPRVGLVHSNIMIIDDKGEIVAENIWYKNSRRDYIKRGREIFDECLGYLHFGASIFIGSVMARRKCYEKVGKFSPELPHCNDSEMWIRMSLFYDVACIGTPLVKYRVHQKTASSNWGDYSSVAYVKEHYLAAMSIFNAYYHLIPDSHRRKKKVSKFFAERSIKLAKTAIVNGDYFSAKTFVKEAIRMYSWIIKNPFFWIVIGGISVGPSGLKYFKSAKKAFGNKIAH